MNSQDIFRLVDFKGLIFLLCRLKLVHILHIIRDAKTIYVLLIICGLVLQDTLDGRRLRGQLTFLGSICLFAGA